MIRRGTVGSGLTKKPTLGWNDDADEADPEVGAIIEASTLAGMIAATEGTCFRILTEAGLPGRHGCYQYKRDTGEWREPRPPFGGWSIANTVEPVARAAGFTPDSPVGYAAAILDRIFWLRDNQRRGDHDRAALFAFYIGVLKAESRIKVEHQSTWDTGDKVLSGAASTRRGDQSARVAEVDRLAAEIGKGGKTAAFAIVAEREGVTAKAIETDYYKARRKTS